MTPHIEAKKGDYAETVLLPGDPLRAKYISEYFDDVKQVNGVSEGAMDTLDTIKERKFQFKLVVWDMLVLEFMFMSCIVFMVSRILFE